MKYLSFSFPGGQCPDVEDLAKRIECSVEGLKSLAALVVRDAGAESATRGDHVYVLVDAVGDGDGSWFAERALSCSRTVAEVLPGVGSSDVYEVGEHVPGFRGRLNERTVSLSLWARPGDGIAIAGWRTFFVSTIHECPPLAVEK